MKTSWLIHSICVVLLLLMAGTMTSQAAVKKKATVLNGIDVLKTENYEPLRGKKVALLTNQTGQDKEGNSTIDLLYSAPGVELVALFAPEHGIRGDKDQAVIEDGKDNKTGLPVYSLYGKTRKPSSEQMKGLDAFVFDIQDIGCRFYTYISTMANCLEVAGKEGVEFIVLDRINPINGRDVEGPVQIEKSTFVGIHPIAIRHGMTIGEIALMLNAECDYHAKVTVIKMKGWKRKMWQDETDIPWVNTSPNMRSLWEATLYPGIGVLEFTPIATGRGTAIPFELFGAPYIAFGCRVADFQKLTMANVGVDKNGIPYIHYLPNKTKKEQRDNSEIETPIIRYALDIVKKYKFNFHILHYVSGDWGYNAKIKQLLQKCGIDRECNVYNEEIEDNEYKPLYELASSKLCRKTHVDIMNKAQVNLYAAGLHRIGSDAVNRYTKLELSDKFKLMCFAFGQPEYKVDKSLNVIE